MTPSWETKEQEKGYHALKFWLHRQKDRPNPVLSEDIKVRKIDLFFIQKFHDSAEWFAGLLGGQVRKLQDEIFDLKSRVAELEKICNNNKHDTQNS